MYAQARAGIPHRSSPRRGIRPGQPAAARGGVCHQNFI